MDRNIRRWRQRYRQTGNNTIRLRDLRDLARARRQVVQRIRQRRREPDIALPIDRVFDRDAEVSGVGICLERSTVDVDAADGVGGDGREPEIPVVCEGADDGRAKECEWDGVFCELFGLDVEFGNLIASELADPDVAAGYDVDAYR